MEKNLNFIVNEKEESNLDAFLEKHANVKIAYEKSS